MAFTVHLRDEEPPADFVIMLRAGERGVAASTVMAAAARSRAVLGIVGISVVAGLAGESLSDAWEHADVTRERDVVWWTTAGRLRSAGFPLLPTGRDIRHYSVVLADLSESRIAALAAQFTRAARQ